MPGATTSFFLLFARALQGAPQILRQERDRKRFLREYTHAQRLPDEILRDVGLTRDQIRHAKLQAQRAGFGSRVERGD